MKLIVFFLGYLLAVNEISSHGLVKGPISMVLSDITVRGMTPESRSVLKANFPMPDNLSWSNYEILLLLDMPEIDKAKEIANKIIDSLKLKGLLNQEIIYPLSSRNILKSLLKRKGKMVKTIAKALIGGD